MQISHLKYWIFVGLMLFVPRLYAEDIDLFMGVAPPSESDLPNVLIILDNTGNWNAAFDNQKAALTTFFNNLPVNKYNVGLMMFGQPASGYVRAAIRTMDANNRTIYSNMINSFDASGDSESARTLARTMSEAHRYLAGLESTGAGADHSKRDYTGNTSGNAASNAVYAQTGNALSSAAATVYNSPISPLSCGRTYIIYIGNTVSSGNVVKDNNARNVAARNELIDAGGDATEIPLAYSAHQDNVADEWARFLKQSMGVITYTVDVDPTPLPGGHANGMGNSALLKSMADESGGKYFRVNSSIDSGNDILLKLETIFGEIQAVNSVFATSSLPVSANTQGTYLNQVFMGMFRPDASALPRWNGNLKQYQFIATIEGSGFGLRLADADSSLAINPLTGFITQCARSFWTLQTLDDYWDFADSSALGTCTAISDSKWSNSPDGEVVEKGGVGFRLRATTPASRNVKTCNDCTTSVLVDFDTANAAITQGALGAADSSQRDNIINWVRGQDIHDENSNSNTAEMRPSLHGDVVHSRPAAVDYGGTTGVVVFYGANDGTLRAIDGNQTGFTAGQELWAFAAPEQFGRLKRLFDNDVAIPYPSAGGPNVKPYFFDGPVTAVKDNGTVSIYATQRRGGRMVYAFDVTTPSTPSLKWRRGCNPSLTEDVCTSNDFAGIGQTWSTPKPLKAQGYGAGTSPMIIIGGGYDVCEDAEPNTCTSPKGNKVYVLDANTGALLQTFSTDRSVVGDVIVVTNQATGLANYAYLADTGGNLYRITFGELTNGFWSMTKIASLGCDVATCVAESANRKFLFGPEVVVTPYFNAVLLGSGDREHPLTTNTVTAGVQNAFFMIKDKPSDTTWLPSENANCGADVICMDSLITIGNTDANPSKLLMDASKGWALMLSATEQVVTSAVVLFGETIFSTHMPTAPEPGSCSSNLGTARVYTVQYLSGSAVGSSSDRFAEVSGGGLSPSPAAGMVTLANPITGQPMTVPFVIGGNATSPLEVTLKTGGSGASGNKERVFWYIER